MEGKRVGYVCVDLFLFFVINKMVLNGREKLIWVIKNNFYKK
jgi:hypothetical protein